MNKIWRKYIYSYNQAACLDEQFFLFCLAIYMNKHYNIVNQKVKLTKRLTST
jgi:hypothetical protein